MRLQWQGMRTNNLGVILGTVVLFMAVSSFLADTFNVVDRLGGPQRDGWDILTWIITFIVGLVLLGVLMRYTRRLLNRVISRRMRKAEAYSARLAEISKQTDKL